MVINFYSLFIASHNQVTNIEIRDSQNNNHAIYCGHWTEKLKLVDNN